MMLTTNNMPYHGCIPSALDALEQRQSEIRAEAWSRAMARYVTAFAQFAALKSRLKKCYSEDAASIDALFESFNLPTTDSNTHHMWDAAAATLERLVEMARLLLTDNHCASEHNSIAISVWVSAVRLVRSTVETYKNNMNATASFKSQRIDELQLIAGVVSASSAVLSTPGKPEAVQSLLHRSDALREKIEGNAVMRKLNDYHAAPWMCLLGGICMLASFAAMAVCVGLSLTLGPAAGMLLLPVGIMGVVGWIAGISVICAAVSLVRDSEEQRIHSKACATDVYRLSKITQPEIYQAHCKPWYQKSDGKLADIYGRFFSSYKDRRLIIPHENDLRLR